MKKKKLLNIIIVTVGLLLIVLGIVYALTNNRKEEEKPNKEVLVDDKIVNLIFNIPSIYKTNLKNSYYVYQDKKVSIDTVNKETIFGSTLNILSTQNIRSCNNDELVRNPNCDFVVESNVLQEKVRQLYGEENSVLPNKVSGNGVLNCTLEKNNYECTNHDETIEEINNEYTSFFGNANYMNIKKVFKAEEDEDNLYIYEKYVNLRLVEPDEMDYNNINAYNYRVYKYSNSDVLLTNDTIVGKKLYENKSVTLEKQILDIYFDKASTFMHTFKKLKDNKYIYVSTNEVK